MGCHNLIHGSGSARRAMVCSHDILKSSALLFLGAVFMQSRRNFIGKVATGLAGTLATSNVLGANDRIRLGIIGPGARGSDIMQDAIGCPNTEFVAVADIYTRRLEEAKAKVPNAKTYLDYRYLLDDKSID